MTVKEVTLTETIRDKLISLSEDWEKENSCHGYRKNGVEDLQHKKIFLATDGDAISGYLFGHNKITETDTSIYKAGTKYFEIDEIYVKPEFRNQGTGKKLFEYAEAQVCNEVDMIMLGTAAKNFRAILHFYIDELGMEFWSARLFKKI